MASYDEKLARVCWEVQARTCKRCLTMFWVDRTILVAGVPTLDIKHCWHVCAGKSQAATTGSGTAPSQNQSIGGLGVAPWLRPCLVTGSLKVLFLALKTAKVRYGQLTYYLCTSADRLCTVSAQSCESCDWLWWWIWDLFQKWLQQQHYHKTRPVFRIVCVTTVMPKHGYR